MKTAIINTDKRSYISPEIECIVLDNEISLSLESNPGSNDGDEVSKTSNYNNDPYKNNKA